MQTEAPTRPPATSTTTSDEQRVNFGGRIRESVRKRFRRYAVEHDLEIQDVLDTAMDEWLRERGF